MSRLFLVLVLSAGLVAPLHAQSPETPTADATKVWIFFTDKGETSQRAAPVAITERARARRALRGTPEIPALVDVPVAPAYIATLEGLGIDPIVQSRWFNAVSAALTHDQREAVAALPFVRGLQPVGTLTTQSLPSLTPLEMPVGGIDFGPSLNQLQFVHADATITAGYHGSGVRLGYLDTLFDFDHQGLAHIEARGHLIDVQDFTGQSQSNFHGLSTTSVALGFDEGDLIGPANDAEVLAATTEYAPTETHQEEDFFVAGLEWLEVNGVEVVNSSLGYSTFDPGEGDYTYQDMDGDTAIVTQAADRAVALGVVFVTSAGNEGDSSWMYITAPADGDSVITVGAATLGGNRAGFSSVGPTFDGRTKPDVSALGVDVYVARSNGGYGFSNGTSFSSPMVAGIVCQLLQADPSLNPIQVRDLLRQTASQASAPDNELGWGIVDAEAALLVLTANEAHPTATTSGWRVLPNVARAGRPLIVEIEAGSPGPVQLDLIDALGRHAGTLYTGSAPVGRMRIPLAVPSLPTGTYFVRVTGADRTGTARLTILR